MNVCLYFGAIRIKAHAYTSILARSELESAVESADSTTEWADSVIVGTGLKNILKIHIIIAILP